MAYKALVAHAHVRPHPEQQKTFKYKGFEFAHLEGIMKNSDDYLDAEEIS